MIAGADANLRVSKEVIETLRNQVFGFDTMWVTSVDNYQADGVVFKGNIRSKDIQAAYAKLKERLAVSRADHHWPQQQRSHLVKVCHQHFSCYGMSSMFM